MVLSDKQELIKQTFLETDLNILTSACAGSGKTSTLMMLLELCDNRTLFLAFNKSIQEEIQAKIDEKGLRQGKALTLHSLGLSAIKNAYNKVFVKSSKNIDLIKKLQEEFKKELKSYKWQDRLKLTYFLMDINDISRLFLTNNLEEIKKYMLSMDKPFHSFNDLGVFWERLIELRTLEENKQNINVDFIDMIYLPVIKGLYIPIEPVYLFLDEVQDLNLLQHKFVDNLIAQRHIKKWVAVGDRKQAIYLFSGAYSSSFELFLEKDNVIELDLDICYRCSQNVIDAANEVYDVMQYGKEEQGIVETINDYSLVKDNSMVICRNSSPLISLYFNLLGEGKKVYIKGEDILSSIVRFLKPFVKEKVYIAKQDMSFKLHKFEDTDQGRIEAYYFEENFNNFITLQNALEISDSEIVGDIISKIEALFVEQKDAIMLCTIHKSKGLEADVVYILNENLIPSKFAKSEEQLKQEMNLKYVARTRAKKELYYLNL
jgi:superfamily I DNA/RNA helicase